MRNFFSFDCVGRLSSFKNALFVLFFMFLFSTSQLFSQPGGGGGGGIPIPATVRIIDLYQMLDTAFAWQTLQLPERDIPASLGSNLSLRRAWVLNIAYYGNDSVYYAQRLCYLYFAEVLYELFFNNANCEPGYSDYWWDVKYRLQQNYKINIDSMEAIARSSTFPPPWIQENDTVSKGVLGMFAKRAVQTPILKIKALEWTKDDAIEIPLSIENNYHQLGGFNTKLSTWTNYFVQGVQGQNGFTTTFMGGSGDCGYRAAVAGMNNNGGFGSNNFKLAILTVVPWSSNAPIYQSNAYLADTIGVQDFPVWAHKSVTRVYSRYDMNQNLSSTTTDAVFGARLFRREIPPNLPHLGDVNYNNIFDGDDPLQIFYGTLWGKSSYDSSSGIIHVVQTENENTVTVTLSFDGNLGSARRFGGSLIFDAQLTTPNVQFNGTVLESLSGSDIVEDGKLNILFYDTLMQEGSLATITFTKTGQSNVSPVTITPIAHNFFTFNENIVIEYSALGVSDEISVIPLSFTLEQNHPNPFNPTTIITYTLSAKTLITLKVFDVLGKEIATLVNKEIEAGRHEVQFDASQIPSGMYFYRLAAGNFIETKKMVLMK